MVTTVWSGQSGEQDEPPAVCCVLGGGFCRVFAVMTDAGQLRASAIMRQLPFAGAAVINIAYRFARMVEGETNNGGSPSTKRAGIHGFRSAGSRRDPPRCFWRFGRRNTLLNLFKEASFILKDASLNCFWRPAIAHLLFRCGSFNIQTAGSTAHEDFQRFDNNAFGSNVICFLDLFSRYAVAMWPFSGKIGNACCPCEESGYLYCFRMVGTHLSIMENYVISLFSIVV